jgi:N-acyl-D-amino-acid deacylase
MSHFLQSMSYFLQIGLGAFLIIVFIPRIAVSEERSLTQAVQKGATILEQSGHNWKKNKTCFSCHHQTLPMLGLVEASALRDPKQDRSWLKMQADLTHEFFQERKESLNKRNSIGGGATSVAFGLWAMYLDQRMADETTEAMIRYLLHVQHKEGYWFGTCNRPPLQQSNIAVTVMVLQYAPRYASPSQQAELKKAQEKALQWLEQAPLKTQEDRVWRLWGLHTLGDRSNKATIEKIQALRQTILENQRKDGGWNQAGDLKEGQPEKASDAYSTGQTLFILRLTGSKIEEVSLVKASRYLLEKQDAGGSWHVKTRVRPVQADFDNGDPHGKDQFLSIAATGWAVTGLAQMLPPKESPSVSPAK